MIKSIEPNRTKQKNEIESFSIWKKYHIFVFIGQMTMWLYKWNVLCSFFSFIQFIGWLVGWLVGQLVNIMAIYLSMKLLKNYHHYHHHNIVTNHIVNSQFIQFNNLIHLDFCKSFILFLPPKKKQFDFIRLFGYYENLSLLRRIMMMTLVGGPFSL